MSEWYEIFIKAITAISIGGVAFFGAFWAACTLYPLLVQAWDLIGKKRLRGIFLLAVIGATMYGGSKGFVGSVTFEQTDPEVWYLRDAGSAVSNDYVHIAFTKNVIVPDSAFVYVDALESCYTNASDWAEHAIQVWGAPIGETGTLADGVRSFDIPFDNATNYNFLVYTDWTPGPVTHTNGVAYVTWQVGANKSINDIAITRTGVYTNSVKLAPNPAITNLPSTGAAIEATIKEKEE